MIKATGSQIICKMLELEGITQVAGIPGGYILPLYDELNKSSIKHILVRHEQAAGFIAQGMTRSTGKPAVCMVTSGPGAMNLLTAIGDARCDSIPMVAFTGQVNTNLIGTDAFQEADTFGLSFPITKHSMMVKDASELLTAIPKAFEIAVSGRPGPVLIDVPKDVQLQTVEFEKWPQIKNISKDKHSEFADKFKTPKEQAGEIIENMAKVLCSSKKGVLFLGGGTNNPQVSECLKELLADSGFGVTTSLMGIGAVPRSYQYNLGMVGMHGTYAANCAMHDADVILALGVRFDDRATGVISKFCPNAKILHIDIDAAEINKILDSHISLVEDLEIALPALVREVIQIKRADKEYTGNHTERTLWLDSMKKLLDETDSVEIGHPESSDLENPRAFIKAIPENAEKAGVKPEDIIVTTDVGQHQMWSAQFYPVEKPRQFLTSGSLGTMGFGLPAAIGAALANKDKRVVCISGDGSIMMNIQELATLAENKLNVTLIILKNGTLGMVRQQQEYLFDKNYSASIFEYVPDFIQIAKGFGIDAVDATTDKEWYKKAFTAGPHVVKLDISMGENVLPFVSAGRANIDPFRTLLN